MWLAWPGVANPPPLDTSGLFHNQQSRRPACLAGRNSTQTAWSTNAQNLAMPPHCQHLAPPHSKECVHSQCGVAKLGRGMVGAPSSAAPLSPVPETPCLRLRWSHGQRPGDQPCQVVGQPCAWLGPSPLLSPRVGSEERYWDCITDNPGAWALSGSRRDPASERLRPKPDTGKEGTALCWDLRPPSHRSTGQ